MRRSSEPKEKGNKRKKQMASQRPKKDSRAAFHEEGMPKDQGKHAEQMLTKTEETPHKTEKGITKAMHQTV